MKWQKLFSVIPLFGFTLLLSLFLRYQIPAFERLELTTIDWRFAWRGVEPVQDSPIVLVVIDDYSFEALPERWPYPRSYYAHLIENLTRAGAAVIGLDLIFDVADRYGPEKDAALAVAIRESGRVVLARKLEIDSRLQSYRFLVEPIPLLKEAAEERLGLVSIESDRDGIYRRYPVYQPHNQEKLFSFVIELIQRYHGEGERLDTLFSEGKLKLGELEIPFYDAANLLINFAGPAGTFPQYSLASVIDDERLDLGEKHDLNYFSENLLPEEVFKGKIVLVGATVAELHDNFPTPFLEYHGAPKEMPGVEILANAARTIYTQSFFRKPSFALTLALTAALMLVIFALCFFFPTFLSSAITLGMMMLITLAQFLLFSRLRVVGELFFPVMGVFLAFVSATLYQFVLTQREKRKIMGAFQQYVPAKVIKELLANPEKLTLGGEERYMTVLFSDLANFTTIAESMAPRELVKLINEYLSEMTDIILRYDGIIDKYEGDAIMAEFGAPVHYPDHALKACYAALDMQRRLKMLSREWRRQGRPVLTCRTGVNSGNMIVGNMGSARVFDYTVIGDEVNLAARLEGANKTFGTANMISESTYNEVKDAMITRPIDLIVVKGRQKPVQVFELLARKDEKIDELIKKLLPIYRDGVHYYHHRKWELAAESFRLCLQMVPDDGPSRLYLKRVLEYAKNPPPEDWDGVYALKSK